MCERVNRYTVSFEYVGTFCVVWHAIRSAASPPIIKERQYGFQKFRAMFSLRNRRTSYEKAHEKEKQGVSPAFSQIWSVISVVNLALIWYTENNRRDGGHGNK